MVQAATILFDYNSEDESEIAAIEQAILPETETKGKCILRTRLAKSRGSNHLLLEFVARDVVSLRASTNTNLRLINSAVKSLRAVTKEK
jgi:tRNA threonylcarbamoyladenosine modification (KEOPS) complex  Pcc1 subunit